MLDPATNTVKKYHLGVSQFEPFFALAEKLEVPILIHPSGDVNGRAEYPSSFDVVMLGFLNDERVILYNLLRTGLLERHPNLKIIVTHLGGGILFNIARFGIPLPLPHPIEYYMKKVYYDIASSTVDDIVAAEKIVGADHLLVGTDFPWGNTNFFRPLLKALPFSEDKIKAIAYDNASKLFRIQVEK